MQPTITDPVFIDTSVWITFFRNSDRKIVAQLDYLLDKDLVALAAPVRTELIAGVRRNEQGRLIKSLDALPTFIPQAKTWNLIDSLAVSASAKGDRFGVVDMLIAAISKENSGTLWSLDGDFLRMEKLGFLKSYSFT
jgi:predicted nucleic acid-binding protein